MRLLALFGIFLAIPLFGCQGRENLKQVSTDSNPEISQEKPLTPRINSGFVSNWTQEIEFEKGQWEISAAMDKELRMRQQTLRDANFCQVLVEVLSHASPDEAGSLEQLEKISDQRGAAVLKWLHENGDRNVRLIFHSRAAQGTRRGGNPGKSMRLVEVTYLSFGGLSASDCKTYQKLNY